MKGFFNHADLQQTAIPAKRFSTDVARMRNCLLSGKEGWRHDGAEGYIEEVGQIQENAALAFLRRAIFMSTTGYEVEALYNTAPPTLLSGTWGLGSNETANRLNGSTAGRQTFLLTLELTPRFIV